MDNPTNLMIGLFILVVVGVCMYFVFKPKEDAPEDTTAAAAASSNTAAETSNTATSYTYPKIVNIVPIYKQHDCPSASNVLSTGTWCVFPYESDAQKYCNATPDCAGYSYFQNQGTNSFQVVAGDPNFMLTTKNGLGTDWYPRTTSNTASLSMKESISVLLYGAGGTAAAPTEISLKNYMTVQPQPYGKPIAIADGPYNPSIVYRIDIRNGFRIFLRIGTDETEVASGVDAYKRSVDAINSFNKLTGSDAFPTS
jgi:hypothetical protein